MTAAASGIGRATALGLAADEGGLRFVVNIAGMQHIAGIHQFPTEKDDPLTDITLRSPFKMAQETMSHIRATDDVCGAIVNMSSVHGHYTTKDKPADITAKHGISSRRARFACRTRPVSSQI